MRSLLVIPTGAKRRRQPRPFGQGILDEPTPAPVMPDRLSAAMHTVYGPAPAAPAVDPWEKEYESPAEWPDDTDAERWEPAVDPDAIPASVSRVRLIGGLAEGEYRRVGADRWESERGNVCGADALNRAYVAGRVAILADALPITHPEPAKPATGRPEPFIPSFADCVEMLGFELGRQGIDAAPCKSWQSPLKDRFASGFDRGTAARLTLEAEEARRQAWDDEMEAEALGLNMDPHERAEAGMMPLPGGPMD